MWVSNIVPQLSKPGYLQQLHNKYMNETVGYEQFEKNPFFYLTRCGKFDDDYFEFYSDDAPDTKLYLDGDDIRFLHAQGVVIGNHTRSHPNLAKCDDDTIKREVLQSKEYIESLINKTVVHFAIPFGKQAHYDDRVINTIRICNHRYIYSGTPGSFRESSLGNDSFIIPRIGLTDQTLKELMYTINRTLLRR